MGVISKPPAVKIFIAFLYNPTVPIKTILNELDKRFGVVQFSYGPIPFCWTDYYSEEMGASLQKFFFSYKDSIKRETLPAIKSFTNTLEQQYVDDQGNRLVNIDPGYVTRDKVVLATTKDFYHRIYLGDGIFGEVTLHYRRGRFRYFSWTYPDFKDVSVMQFLERIRALLVKEIRDQQSNS